MLSFSFSLGVDADLLGYFHVSDVFVLFACPLLATFALR